MLDDAACTAQTMRVFFADKPVEDTRVTVGVVSQAQFVALAQALDTTPDSRRGHVLVRIADCGGEAKVGDLTADDPLAGATAFSVKGSKLETGSTSGVDGLVGFLNVDAPFERALVAIPQDIATLSSQGDVVTRPGNVSFIDLVPNSEVVATPPTEPMEWECVGAVPEPVVMASTITLTVEVRESEAFVPSGAPISNARVIVCLNEQSQCTIDGANDPTREARTDAAGIATLTVSTGTEGFDGQIIVTSTLPACQ